MHTWTHNNTNTLTHSPPVKVTTTQLTQIHTHTHTRLRLERALKFDTSHISRGTHTHTHTHTVEMCTDAQTHSAVGAIPTQGNLCTLVNVVPAVVSSPSHGTGTGEPVYQVLRITARDSDSFLKTCLAIHTHYWTHKQQHHMQNTRIFQGTPVTTHSTASIYCSYYEKPREVGTHTKSCPLSKEPLVR